MKLSPTTNLSTTFLLVFVMTAVVRAEDPPRPADDAGAPAASDVEFFEKRIEPVLKRNCYGCHSAAAETVEANLRLDSQAAVLRGGDSGPAVRSDDVEKSLLLQAVRFENGLKMPPDSDKLPDQVVADFVHWVKLGVPHRHVGESGPDRFSPAVRNHWSFQPIRRVDPPDVKNHRWVRTPIDAFTLAALEERGWQPAPEASRGEWIRRVNFDLTGLPPTPAEIDAFRRDRSPDAYERVVDRLLASPQYGERWAQHWLDVVRFAETEGFEYDRHLPDAWRFRDYVIRSFNDDKPFDQFTLEQIAGDELDSSDQDHDQQAAAIFHRLGPVRRNAGNPEIALSRNEVLTERTNIVGVAFLGLTVGCARCHSHKLEPISQRDYYRFQAYFAATAEHNVDLAPADQQRAWQKTTDAIKAKVKQLKEQAAGSSGETKARLEQQAKDLEYSQPPHPPAIPTVRNDFANRTNIHVLRRGVWENKGVPVGPRPLSVLIPPQQPELPADVARPRTHLARWLVDPSNPLTPRVIVNRIWQHHFSRGLVKTANDFGTRAAPPSHPELLDWLAASLVDHGWRLKPLHRMIVLSSTWRQSSRSPHTEEYAGADPENRLLWRHSRRRLSADELRDAMLAVAGRLNRKTGGRSVIVPVDPELVGLLYKPYQWQVTPDHHEHDRRTVYLIAKRNLRLPFMDAFDAPRLQTSCPQRDTSTHAPQTLEMLNGRFANAMARSFAQRLSAECGGDTDRIVERAFRLTLGRGPTGKERELSTAFLKNGSLDEFALAVFNLNGFIYVR